MRNYLHIVAAVIFLGAAAYLMCLFVQAERSPETASVYRMEVDDSVTAEGRVQCDAEYITASFETVYFTVSEGQWVSGGKLVALGNGSFENLITAPCAGYFTRTVGADAPENAVGRIVSGGWRFAAKLKNAGDYRVGQRLYLTVFDKYPAYIEKIDNDTVTVRCKTGLDAVLEADKLKATLSTAELEGLRVPQRALHSDEDGSFVYVLKADKPERTPVDVVFNKNGLCLVKGDGLFENMKVLVG